MTILERLKELVKSNKRGEDETPCEFAGRFDAENLWVRDIALPVLLEAVEAIKVFQDANTAFYRAGCLDSDERGRLAVIAYAALERLDAVLAKLEEVQG